MHDPKPPRRVRDLELLKRLHTEWRGDCVLDDETCVANRYSLHHIHKHPRDDLQANLAMLCGDGTTGHHGRLEHHDWTVSRAFSRYLLTERQDTLRYLTDKLGSMEAMKEWFNSQLHAGL